VTGCCGRGLDATLICVDSLGMLVMEADPRGLSSIRFERKKLRSTENNRPTNQCARELTQYFKGYRKKFSLRLNFQGTSFQKKVWRELLKIPYGQIVSYQEIALRIKKPEAVRAVANAIAQNKIPILVPCHRVIRKDGKLGGYRWGLRRKRQLLKLESGRCSL
jgi:methylated-DNA-[protein]-cysteine S-methyltransferase